ncbi:hypothetical protein [Mycobacterium sp. SMC-13]|uniref:hypothetical protein n=1 Tax=Mycobacterium sp. SMC-13 TaxID=3381626 RepID=UPI0038769888
MSLPDGVTVYETDINTYIWVRDDDERVLIHAELFPIPCFGWTVHAIDEAGVQSRHSVPEGRMDRFAADWCGRVLGSAVTA